MAERTHKQFPMTVERAVGPASDDTLNDLLDYTVDFAKRFRTQTPTKDFSPMVSVLTFDRRWITVIPHVDERVRVLEFLTRTYPVYGYLCTADALITGEGFVKHDAFVFHLGSRTLRRAVTHTYQVKAGATVWGETLDIMPERSEDPYAHVLVRWDVKEPQ